MKKINYKVLTVGLVAIFLAAAQMTSAQTARIAGSVKDENGFPLQGASVFLTGNKTGTVTDSNGHYELRLNPGRHTIASSFVGYSEQVINIQVVPGMATEANFTTTEVYKECAEVVVVCSPVNDGKLQLAHPLLRDEINIRGFKKIAGQLFIPGKKSLKSENSKIN
jgi:iron complex outermembrane receptor protein